jgi:hypothetical protein
MKSDGHDIVGFGGEQERRCTVSEDQYLPGYPLKKNQRHPCYK